MEDAIFLYRLTESKETRDQLCRKLTNCFRGGAFNAAGNTIPPLVEVNILGHLTQVGTDCGAIVMLAMNANTQEFVVIKEYIHESGEWKLPETVLRQLSTYTVIGKDYRCLQQCLDVHITADLTHFIFRYYPMRFDMLFNTLHRTLPPIFLLSKTIELVKAVNLLHTKLNIVHRDIKPQNICLTKRSELVLIDFDSAAVCVDYMRKTLPVCSLATRAPEQLEAEIFGDNKKEYDARAGDWWATGCVIAQMYLGYPLFVLRTTQQHSLSDFLKDILIFCKELQNQGDKYNNSSDSGTYSARRNIITPSQHPQVKELHRHLSLTPAILTLLYGLLSLYEANRARAASDFLQTDFPPSVYQ